MISVVLACCSRDQQQALDVLNWTAELGMNYTKFFLLCSRQCRVDELLDAARKGFSSVTYIQDVEEVDSNWHENGHHLKSAAGPNSLFRQAAWYFYLTEKTRFFFWEPDAIPCHPNWLRDISDEDEQSCKSGKEFLGYEVKRTTHPGDVGHHMSGVAVYPFDVPQKAHTAISAGDTAFDMEGAAKIVPQMTPSRTIFHRYRPESFSSQENFEERVPKHLAIYHACKDGSIYPFLKKRFGLDSKDTRVVQLEERPAPDRNVEGSSHSSRATSVDIYIKTRPHDYPWLEWCLKSIEKFATGFREVRGQTERGGMIPYAGLKGVISTEEGKEPGYLWQQVCKLYADEHTDAEYILYMDSDCVFTRPVSPSDFIRDEKPIWLYTPLDQARPDQHVWAPVMEKFLGRKPQHEFMRRHPFCVQRWMLEEFRKFCGYRHGVSLKDYIMGQADPGNALALVFSEWNCLGFFLWEYHRDRVEWVLDSEAEPACVWQGFTHGGEERKQQDLAKFREILGEDVHGSVSGPEGVHLPSPVLTEDIAIEFLANSVRDNFHKARISRKLQKAWKGKGTPPKAKIKVIPAPKNRHPKTLLCIHSYPGANETLERHWPQFCSGGFDRIVGIGTTDGKCKFPCESVKIGENAYMKLDGTPDDHLCRRLLETVEFCLTQPEERFVIAEYDVLFLKKFPAFHGVAAFKTGGRVNGAKASQFFHGPWCFDRGSGDQLRDALAKVLPESQSYPDNSPDLFFGLACERAKIKVNCNFRMFTRNSLDAPGDLDLAVEAAVDGVHVIHGVKQEFEYETIMSALNGKHLALSHVA